MHNNKILVVVGLLFLGAIIYYLYQNNLTNGETYANKESLCQDFAQSYLKTVQKTDNAKSSENILSPENQKWEMAIDVETELYNLCLLNLDKESLKNYKPKALEKYQK